jgi:alpha-L-fucosidase 2
MSDRVALFRLALCVTVLAHAVGAAADEARPAPLCLWYAQPASKWVEALPVGNGHVAAMVFGGAADERIQFNEDTLWTGKPHDYTHAGAADYLPEIRRLIAEGKQEEASKIVREKFLSVPVRQRAYQPFGDLRIKFAGHERVTDYRRELDLDSATARVSYRVDGVRFERQVFASYPDRAIVVHVAADQPGKVSITLQMDSPHKVSQTRAIAPDSLALSGQVQDPNRFQYFQVDWKRQNERAAAAAAAEPIQTDGLSFESRVRVTATGGTVSPTDRAITVLNADAVTLVLVAATSFENFQQIRADPADRCASTMSAVGNKPFEALLGAHVTDYQRLFRRVSLDPGTNDRSALPTDMRLQRMKSEGLSADPGLAALYFQYGRYLLIASSRPGSQAANLQGVWNDSLDPPWESKYTTNINAEMNYWPAEVTNLSECHEPLFDLIDDCVVSGRRTAQVHYNARGWVLHHNTDLWRGTAPINNIDGQWPTGGAWLCHHLWEHYLFTGDRAFLAERAYPVMKEACAFFMDYLVKDPKTGWLVSTPSHSPEQGGLVAGPAMDHQLVRALFDYTIEAAQILRTDADFLARLREARRRVAPDRVGKHGQLQEWLDDIDLPNNKHRHMSPLWCLYPGWQVTPFDADPTLYRGAKTLLDWRGDGSTGWSYAWRMNLRARTGEGNAALAQFEALLGRKTLPNLFDLCGPFQIDGNFGAAAGIAEMLLQSHVRGENQAAREIHLLPALPRAWAAGSVTGLCARGGFEVDISWQDHALTRAVIRSKIGSPLRLRYGRRTMELNTRAGHAYAFDGQLGEIK